MCKTEVESTFSQGAGEEPAAYMRFPSKRKCEETEETLSPLDSEMQTLARFQRIAVAVALGQYKPVKWIQVPHQSRAPQFYQTCLQNQI